MKRVLVCLLVMGIICSSLTGGAQTYVIFAASNSSKVVKSEDYIVGLSSILNSYYNSNGYDDNDSTNLLAEPIVVPDNIAIANVNTHVNIRKAPGIDQLIVGILPKDAYALIEEVAEGWAKITSGGVSGYVSTEYMFTGDTGYEKAVRLAKLVATVTAGTVNLREEPSTTSTILTQVSKSEKLDVIDAFIVNKDETEVDSWVKVQVDDIDGYIAEKFCTVNYEWIEAVKVDGAGETASALRTNLVLTAKKYIGLKYVWGGNSLINGTDCSGFAILIYKECGLDTSDMDRQSTMMADSSGGEVISISQIQPGDIVFYGNSSGKVNHVAMYIGNGQVIHESGRVYGCRISNINYRKVLKVKNYIDN